jgi:hypothetical protein
MDLPVELVGLLKHAGIDGKKLTWDLQVNSSVISVKLMWIKAEADALSISFPGGRREVFFFWAWLVTFPVLSTGFSALIHITLTDITLELTCRSQVIFFPFMV